MRSIDGRRADRRTFLAAGAAGSACVAMGAVARDDAPAWRAGVARAVITPESPVWLAGYGTRRVPDGKLHDLWMKALALEAADGTRVVLVTSDFQGVPASMSDRVFAAVEARHGLGRDRLMITFSHNHCGPRLGDDLRDYYPEDPDQERLVAAYTDACVEQMTGLVGEALASLAPATLATGRGRCTFAVNRRANAEAEVPALLAAGTPLAGPVDHDVPLLAVRGAGGDGGLMAILFGYACHPTTLNFTTWCGDYPGFAQLALEERHPGAAALFVNTCGGDQNPLPRRSVELCRKYGLELAGAVGEALGGPLDAVGPGLRAAFRHVDLPYLDPVSRQSLAGAAADANPIKARWARRLLADLDGGATFATSARYPLRAWRLGGRLLVLGMGAETVVDYALRFKERYGRDTLVCGYADDMLAYIPSRRVWEEGGYEGGAFLYEYGRPATRWAGDVEERIVQAIDALVRDV